MFRWKICESDFWFADGLLFFYFFGSLNFGISASVLWALAAANTVLQERGAAQTRTQIFQSAFFADASRCESVSTQLT